MGQHAHTPTQQGIWRQKEHGPHGARLHNRDRHLLPECYFRVQGSYSSLVSRQASASIFHKSASLSRLGRTHICPLCPFLSLVSVNRPHGQGEAFRIYSDVSYLSYFLIREAKVIWEWQSLRLASSVTHKILKSSVISEVCNRCAYFGTFWISLYLICSMLIHQDEENTEHSSCVLLVFWDAELNFWENIHSAAVE